MWQSGKVAKWQANYAVQIRQIRAENRPKSRVKIWRYAKNVVPLYQ